MANPERRTTVILDNFASHRSLAVRNNAEELNVRLVFLSPYSPDLNPIEFLWKSIKRVVSRTFIVSEWHLKTVIESAFLGILSINSYAAGWIRVFIPSRHNKYRRLGV